ncbi:hypothetical protein HAX54_019475, partial [Datura stramonium]|nr:hypothetical protein [Datura stramonium]
VTFLLQWTRYGGQHTAMADPIVTLPIYYGGPDYGNSPAVVVFPTLQQSLNNH